MKKKLALTLATIATLGSFLTGCGEKDVHGKYVAEVKLADYFDESDFENMGLEEVGIDSSSLRVVINLELTEDNNFSVKYDVSDFVEEYKTKFAEHEDEMVASYIDLTLAQSDMTREDVTDEIAQANNYDSAEALLEDLETEAVTQVQAQCDSYVEALEDGMKESDFSGTYKVSNSKLVLISDGENSETLDDGTIKDDGTITFSGEDDGVKYSMDFKLQK